MNQAPLDIRLFDAATLKNPYPAYKTLRESAPVYFSPDMGIHVVTRYDLIREALKDTETFSSRFDGFLAESQRMAFESAGTDAQQRLLEIAGQMIEVPPTMLTLDEPDHRRYRSLVAELFTGSRIKRAEGAVQTVIDQAVEGFGDSTAVELMGEFAFPVPLAIIAERLGIPEAERTFFNEAATAAASQLRLTPLTDEQLVHRAQLALDLQRLLIELIEARRRAPRDDMISLLATRKLEGEDRYLTHGETISILNQFLVAGHETTSSSLGWGVLLWCENPWVEDELRRDPAQIRTFVEEALRLESPVQGLPRLVTRDTELGGYPLKGGTLVMLRYGAGNRDGAQFAHPDDVDLTREKAGMQLAFGSGVHHCIGAPLARQELNLAFAALLRHGSGFRLDPDHPAPDPEASFVLRNLPELHIRFDR